MAVARIHKGKKMLLIRKPTFKTWYWFVHHGNNGEPIATSELYTSKQAAEDTLRRYYPTFDVQDMTGEKEYRKFP